MPAGTLLPTTVHDLLDAYEREHGRAARFWINEASGWVLAHPDGESAPSEPGPGAVPVPDGRGTDLRVEVVGEPQQTAPSARFLAAAAAQLLQHDHEVQSYSREFAQTYEEITLLYSISEILGAVITPEKAAEKILREVVGTLSARRAALWVYTPEQEQLRLVAAVGGAGQAGPIAVADPCSVTAYVFREQRAVLLAPDEGFPRPGCEPLPRQPGSLLSVPVSYTPPTGGARTVGVINLIGRSDVDPFFAGDLKLLSAIASQIGAALENNRLIRESLRQERWAREMELAHDLQLKLLPSLEPFAGEADIAARSMPAESVGGDFYHLFRLGPQRLGVMIGDVSGHGFGAALIMAMTMSAVAIHAADGHAPAEVLRRVHHALIGELESTAMYMTLFYGVIDAEAGRLTYANAGHAHAFRIPADGEPTRLGATNPPFGIVDLDRYAEETTRWEAGRDLLFLFTDGLSDAVGAGEIEGSRVLLEAVASTRQESAEVIMEELFQRSQGTSAIPSDDRTALLVRV